MAENSNERAERRVWTAGVVDEQTATVRAFGPGQDAAATALAGELLQIAEQALEDRPMAERIVTSILRNESQLVTTATRAVTPSQREAAQEALARAVRRAVLDAIPPVVPAPVTDRRPRQSAPDGGKARKLRPMEGRGTPVPDNNAPGKVASTKDASGKDTAAPRAAPSVGGKQRGGLMIVLGLVAIVAGGFALWHFMLRPAADQAAPPPSAANVPSSSPTASQLDAETLQLEAVEPSRGPFPPTGDADDTPSAAGEEGVPVAPLAALTGRPIDMGPVAALDPVSASGGIGLPAGSGDLRIFILYPEGDPAATEAGALYAALSQTGQLPLVVLREVGFTIASPRIRYFYPADAEAGRALADFLDAPTGEWTVQDFSHIRPLPAPGTVEIYIPSS